MAKINMGFGGKAGKGGGKKATTAKVTPGNKTNTIGGGPGKSLPQKPFAGPGSKK